MTVKDRIDAIGHVLRFVTPTVIAVFGWISVTYLSSIDRKFEQIDNKFDTFIQSYHIIDKRVDRLEYKVYGTLQKGE